MSIEAKSRRKEPYWFKACVGESALLTRDQEQRRLTVVRTVPGDHGGVDVDFGGLRLWLPRHHPVAVQFGDSRVMVSAGHVRDHHCKLAITTPATVEITRPRSVAKGAA
jgi:hypothetical protein